MTKLMDKYKHIFMLKKKRRKKKGMNQGSYRQGNMRAFKKYVFSTFFFFSSDIQFFIIL